MKPPVYTALVHHPVRDRSGRLMTSAITNVDVHDLARSARTFGLRGYFVVSPIAAQRELVDRILEHWRTGAGARRVPERSEALARCVPVASIEEARTRIERDTGRAPRLLVTEARPLARHVLDWTEARRAVAAGDRPWLLLFGTAHGLHASVLEAADLVVAPIQGVDGYNHLSVRAAAAITFDRLFGREPLR